MPYSSLHDGKNVHHQFHCSVPYVFEALFLTSCMKGKHVSSYTSHNKYNLYVFDNLVTDFLILIHSGAKMERQLKMTKTIIELRNSLAFLLFFSVSVDCVFSISM